MDLEYLHCTIVQFIRTQDFCYFLFSDSCARDRAFARDYAIVRDVSAMQCSPAIRMRAFAKRMARINSPLARLKVSSVGIKNACVYGHEYLAKWYYLRAIESSNCDLVEYALKGAYFAGNRAIIDYFLPLANKDKYAYLSAFCGAVKGNHMELLTWLDSFEYESYDEMQKWWCCGAAAAIKGGHMDLYENFKAHICHDASAIDWVNDLIWSHMLKRDNRARIEQCISSFGSRYFWQQLAILRYASRDVLRGFICALYENELNIRDLREVCSDGNLARVQLIFEVTNDCGYDISAQDLSTCISQKNNNLAITALLVNQLAHLTPLSDYYWRVFLFCALDHASVAEVQCITGNARILGHVIPARSWRMLMAHTSNEEMRAFLARAKK